MKRILPIIILSTFMTSCTNSIYDDTEKSAKNKVGFASSIVDKLKISNEKSRSSSNLTGSKDADYKRAINLVKKGEYSQGVDILQDLTSAFPNYTPAKETLNRLESPFTLSSSIVERHIEDWINEPSSIPEFDLKQPNTPELPKHPVLKKGEFETTNEFNLRVNAEEKEYQNIINDIKQEYQNEVDAYNQAINTHNAELEWERKSRAEKVPAMRKRYLDVAFSEVLGEPKLKDLNYDADNETFYGKITSSSSNLILDVEIPVVLAKAESFKKDSDLIEPFVKIDLIDGNVVFSKILLNHNGESYQANLLDTEKNISVTPDITIGRKGVNLNTIEFKKTKQLTVKQIVKDNRQFFTPKI